VTRLAPAPGAATSLIEKRINQNEQIKLISLSLMQKTAYDKRELVPVKGDVVLML
jgi:hypothetical protein